MKFCGSFFLQTDISSLSKIRLVSVLLATIRSIASSWRQERFLEVSPIRAGLLNSVPDDLRVLLIHSKSSSLWSAPSSATSVPPVSPLSIPTRLSRQRQNWSSPPWKQCPLHFADNRLFILSYNNHTTQFFILNVPWEITIHPFFSRRAVSSTSFDLTIRAQLILLNIERNSKTHSSLSSRKLSS